MYILYSLSLSLSLSLQVIRQQTCNITQEATSYISENLWNISTHFLVTVELLSTQLHLPTVYIDTELVQYITV